MSIQEILGTAGAVDPVKGGSRTQAAQKGSLREKEGTETDEKSDRVDVSEEARVLYESKLSGRFETIRERIRQGFYFQKEVTEKVVDAMLKDIKKALSES